MLDSLSNKIDLSKEMNGQTVQQELALVKAQMKELNEFHRRLKEMSPISNKN